MSVTQTLLLAIHQKDLFSNQFACLLLISSSTVCECADSIWAASYELQEHILWLIAKSSSVDPTGLEPVSSSLQMKCSTN